MKSLEFVFKKLNFTMVLGSQEPQNSDFVSSTNNKLQDIVLCDFNLVNGQIPFMYEMTTIADYIFSHDNYNAVWFAPCGRHEPQVTTVSRIFVVNLMFIGPCVIVITEE